MLIAYHGTSRENAAQIVANGFRPSKEKKECSISSFGAGVYFFIDKILAEEHARLEYRHFEPVTIEVFLNLDYFDVRKVTSAEVKNGHRFLHGLSGDIINGTVNRGMYVVRPHALHAIFIRSVHPVLY